MDQLLSLLAEKGGSIGVALLILIKIGEMIWNYFRVREKLTNDALIQLKADLKANTEAQAVTQSEMKKLKKDLRRAYFLLRKALGDAFDDSIDEILEKEKRKSLER